MQRIDKSTGGWGTVGAGVFLKSDTLGSRYYFITARHLYLAYDSINLIYHTYALTRTGKHLGLRIGSDVLNRKVIPAYVPKTEDSDFVVVPIVPDTSITLGGIAFEECAKFDDLDYGQSVQFYGFPSYDFLGLSIGEYDFPVCRTGHIAYFFVDSMETKDVKTGVQRGMFLVDGFSIGGNSGGPLFAFDNLTFNDRPKLAGIVIAHKNVPNRLISPGGAVAADTFSIENANLAIVISMDMILHCLEKLK